MIIFDLAQYLISFLAIWFGTGLIVKSVRKFAHKLKISPFLFSFLVLGFLTSLPEIFIGLTAISKNTPEIMVGNLLGATIVIFTLVIPVLAIFGRGILLRHELNLSQLLLTLGVIISPALIVLDQNITILESAMLMALYLFLIFKLEKSQKPQFGELTSHPWSLTKAFFAIIIGIILVLVSSFVLVDKTIVFASFLHLSPFAVSLIALSLGSDLPELALGIRAIVSGQKDVAFGDYLGSATANVFILGALTFLSGNPISIFTSFRPQFAIILASAVLIYFFSKNGNRISAKNGWLLFCLYLAFLISELVSLR